VQQAAKMMTVEAEVRVPVATAQIAHFHMTHPADNFLREEDAFWLDMCLTPRPRNARACYRDHWAPHRFERLGTLFALPPGQTIHARSDGGSPQTSILCHLRPEAMREWFDGELEWTDRRLKASLDIPDPHIRGLLVRIADEMRCPGFASTTLIELMVGQLAIELSRYWATIKEGPTTGGLAAWRLRLIDERLRELGDAPSLTELADLCNLSVRQLTRGFRASFNRSIGEHVAQCRLDNAKRLLTTDQSIKAVAYSVGFASPSSFTVAFRRATGVTPRQFRQRRPR
jgi:AraC family transcriptional regulator